VRSWPSLLIGVLQTFVRWRSTTGARALGTLGITLGKAMLHHSLLKPHAGAGADPAARSGADPDLPPAGACSAHTGRDERETGKRFFISLRPAH
jgi:hypothetical protein